MKAKLVSSNPRKIKSNLEDEDDKIQEFASDFEDLNPDVQKQMCQLYEKREELSNHAFLSEVAK